MTSAKEQPGHRRRSAGRRKETDHGQRPDPGEGSEVKYETVPPEERKPTKRGRNGGAGVVKTIVVRDENGRLVSVTRVAPDSTFGVGVKAPTGHTVEEVEAVRPMYNLCMHEA